eukprot:TRINITY_DN318_c0_g1_i4.p1 TRINITY_DN318_c0_g1~~TRINITY_DN318_c0_g1_i4.p1  ORF type:complete len:350 (-),score=116.97 TRINITY_DN318_c0_g1_i4:2558-3607(-)
MKTAFVIALLLCVIMIHADNDEYEKEKDFDDRKAKLEVNVGSKKIEIQLERENDKAKTKGKWKFETNVDPAPEIKFKYFQKVSESKTGFFFRVRFESLIEYVESSPVSGFKADSVVNKVIRLRSLSWKPFVHSQRTVDGSKVHTISVNSTTNLIAFKFHFASAPMFNRNTSTVVRPEALKFDLFVNNFAFNQSGSYLGLKTFVISKSKLETKKDLEDDDMKGKTSDKEDGIVMAESSTAAKFSWSPKVSIDGQQVSVIQSSVVRDQSSEANTAKGEDNDDEEDDKESEVVSRVVFTFNKASPWSRMVWDPTIGLDSSSTGTTTESAGHFNTPNVLSLLGCLFFVLLIVV